MNTAAEAHPSEELSGVDSPCGRIAQGATATPCGMIARLAGGRTPDSTMEVTAGFPGRRTPDLPATVRFGSKQTSPTAAERAGRQAEPSVSRSPSGSGQRRVRRVTRRRSSTGQRQGCEQDAIGRQLLYVKEMWLGGRDSCRGFQETSIDMN